MREEVMTFMAEQGTCEQSEESKEEIKSNSVEMDSGSASNDNEPATSRSYFSNFPLKISFSWKSTS